MALMSISPPFHGFVASFFKNPHLPYLTLVALACAAGQVAILAQHPLVYSTLDSSDYVGLGVRLAQHPSMASLFTSLSVSGTPGRTPGYPFLIALAYLLQGQPGGNLVVFIQAGLMVLTAFEFYLLVYQLTRSRVAAMLAGVLIGTNIFLLNWERMIMTESLAIFLVATTVLSFWMWLRYQKASWLVLFGGASFMAIMTRPTLLYLPAALLFFCLISNRRHWLLTLLVAAVIYLPVGSYFVVSDQMDPRSGVSREAGVNLLGKILEYRMQGEGDHSRFPALWQAANELPPGPLGIRAFLFVPGNTPWANLGVDNQQDGPFSREIVLQHPLEYAVKSAQDFRAVWLAPPGAWAPVVNDPWWSLSTSIYDVYLVITLFLASLLLIWRRLDRQVVLCIAAMLATALGLMLITALLSIAGQEDRYRAPVDPLVIVVAIVITSLVVQNSAFAARWRARH